MRQEIEYNKEEQHITECQLEDGTIIEYDMALAEKDNPTPFPQEWLAQYEYIGEGRIYRVNGIVQSQDPRYARWSYFYRRIK